MYLLTNINYNISSLLYNVFRVISETFLLPFSKTKLLMIGFASREIPEAVKVRVSHLS